MYLNIQFSAKDSRLLIHDYEKMSASHCLCFAFTAASASVQISRSRFETEHFLEAPASDRPFR